MVWKTGPPYHRYQCILLTLWDGCLQCNRSRHCSSPVCDPLCLWWQLWTLHFCKLMIVFKMDNHTGQCKRTGGCYNELVVAFYSTGGGVKGKKIYTCWLYYLFINLHLFYLWWHLAHRPPVTLQFMALPSNWWFNSWFGLQIQQSSGVLPWQVFFLV